MVFGNRMSNCSPYDSIVLLGQVLSTGCMYRLKQIHSERMHLCGTFGSFRDERDFFGNCVSMQFTNANNSAISLV